MDERHEKFNNADRPRGKGRKTAVNHEDLQRAIAKYLKSGGRIEKLPEQKSVSNSLVGRRWNNSEVELDPLI